ncbi:unnamed protein product [Amoebophrya sp. A120]|nr:unnamed protein product [Amoebophrya sp. A120]|eukprot:GSA120T00008317001.1
MVETNPGTPSSAAKSMKLFRGLFRGQLTVPRPTRAQLAAKETAVGPVFPTPATKSFPSSPRTGNSNTLHFTLQGGPYDSVWLRIWNIKNADAREGAWPALWQLLQEIVKNGGAIPKIVDPANNIDPGDAKSFAGAAEVPRIEAPKALASKCYPLYVCLQEDSLEELALLHPLKKHGFRYHHVWHNQMDRPDTPPDTTTPNSGPPEDKTATEFIYYKWIGREKDRVPPYSTTQGGVGVLIFSPDLSKLLLVHEYGWWKPVTGMVGYNETKLEAVTRECFEEVGVPIDLEKGMYFLGGWHSGGQWDRVINDEFSTFAVIAKAEEIKVDGEEIKDARWVEVAKIPTSVPEAGTTEVGFRNSQPEIQVEGLGRINPMLCRWLWNYNNNKGFRCQLQDGAVGATDGPPAAPRFYPLPLGQRMRRVVFQASRL